MRNEKKKLRQLAGIYNACAVLYAIVLVLGGFAGEPFLVYMTAFIMFMGAVVNVVALKQPVRSENSG